MAQRTDNQPTPVESTRCSADGLGGSCRVQEFRWAHIFVSLAQAAARQCHHGTASRSAQSCTPHLAWPEKGVEKKLGCLASVRGKSASALGAAGTPRQQTEWSCEDGHRICQEDIHAGDEGRGYLQRASVTTYSGEKHAPWREGGLACVTPCWSWFCYASFAKRSTDTTHDCVAR